MSDESGKSSTRDDDKLTFERSVWPKIELDDAVKSDLKKAFDLFDTNGIGVVGIDAVKVALHALGHDLTAKEVLALRKMFPNDQIQFGEYLSVLTEWILSIDDDTDIKKTFELIDSNESGYIDMYDLCQMREKLGYQDQITDAELADMLNGAQVKDMAKELQHQYEARKEKTRHRKGQGYATQNIDMGTPGLPYGAVIKRTSSEMQKDPENLNVDFGKFKNILQMNANPSESR